MGFPYAAGQFRGLGRLGIFFALPSFQHAFRHVYFFLLKRFGNNLATILPALGGSRGRGNGPWACRRRHAAAGCRTCSANGCRARDAGRIRRLTMMWRGGSARCCATWGGAILGGSPRTAARTGVACRRVRLSTGHFPSSALARSRDGEAPVWESLPGRRLASSGFPSTPRSRGRRRNRRARRRRRGRRRIRPCPRRGCSSSGC